MKEFVQPAQVLLDLDCMTKDEVLALLSDKALELGITNDRDAVKAAFDAREDEGSTGMIAATGVNGALRHLVDLLVGGIDAKLGQGGGHADGMAPLVAGLDAAQAGSLGVVEVVLNAEDVDGKLREAGRVDVDDVLRPA